MGLANILRVQGKPSFKLVSFLLVITSCWYSATAVGSNRELASAAVTLRAKDYHAGSLEAPQRHLLQDNFTIQCYRNQVQCPSGIAECFDAHSNACNGVKDCSDGSDESPTFCSTYTCPIYTAKCPSNVCTTTYPSAPHSLNGLYLCNGFKDCPDNSDEDPTFCASHNCSSDFGALTCPGVKQCIPSRSTLEPYSELSASPTTLCDGVKDCSDGSDEDPTFCSSYACPNGSFKCGNLCIGRHRVCDGHVDCVDGSDESTSLCGPSYDCSLAGGGFQHCPNGVGCYRGPGDNCDGFHNCLDGSDEDPGLCANSTCDPSVNEIKCPSGVGCTGTYFLCDGIYNCVDKSDERADVCANHTCGVDRVKCPSGNGGCISPSWICDGTDNCLDGSDESEATCRTYDCGPDRTRCPSGVGCATTFNLCDGIPGVGVSRCKDGSDEDPAFCTRQLQCPGYSKNIRCKNGTCITGELCDGIASCADGSDEDTSYCESASCPYGEQKCDDGIHCVSVGSLCNGKVDCADGSDEAVSFCTSYKCLQDYQTKCPGGSGQCITNTTLCDGVVDCKDGSDESASFCASYNCGPRHFKCPGTNICVFGALCDGHPDCPDHLDESQAVCNPAATALPTATANPTESPGPSPPTTANPPQTTGAPTPTTAAPGASSPVSANSSPSPGAPSSATPCDVNSSLPNQCFNAQGTASICCPGQCPNTPGDAPACGAPGPSPVTCDPTSSTPNQCLNANGDQSVCCPGNCPGTPGPVARCG